MAKNKLPKTGLTKKQWIGYGLGDFGGCMTFALMGAYVTRYYVNVLKVDTAILATLLLILRSISRIVLLQHSTASVKMHTMVWLS